MIIEHKRDKLINMLIYFLNNTKFPGKTKLFKLLYFSDFLHFRETGKSITGLKYKAWREGPVPDELYKEFKNPLPDLREKIDFPSSVLNDSFLKLTPRSEFDEKYFTKRELRIMKEVSIFFKDTDAENISGYSHLKGHPWQITIETIGKNQEIDYMLALDDEKDSISKEETLERIYEREELERIFT